MYLQSHETWEARAVHLTKPTLLVVDDDDLMLETLTRLLRHFGFNVVAHSDPAQALITLEQRNDIMIMVCDYEMPGINGEDLCRAAKKRFPAMPVFVLSGNYPPEVEPRPWDAWFLKGAPITELISKLNAVMPLAKAALTRLPHTSDEGRENDDSALVS